MPRPKTILQSDFPYHVTGRTHNKEWFPLPLDLIWEIFSEQLTFLNWGFGGEIHSFVLMKNHFHLLLSTPHKNLDKIMAFFMREITKSINKRSGKINQVFGGPHYRCIVDSHHYYLHAYKYVYANPVKARLSERCKDYKYSSLNFLLGQSKATFPTLCDDTLFNDVEGTLYWINKEVDDEAWRNISQALKWKRFKLGKVDRYKKSNPLEKELI